MIDYEIDYGMTPEQYREDEDFDLSPDEEEELDNPDEVLDDE